MISHIKSHIAVGNRKIGKDTAIFNIGPAASCAADKLGLCKVSDICYAKKAERLYPQVLPYRIRQSEIWDRYTFKQIAIAIGEKCKPGKLKYFRFNESGDFRNQSDVIKMDAVAKYLYDNYNIKTYGYTARQDLYLPRAGRDSKYLVITTSGYKQSGFNSFEPVDQFTGENYKCKANCAECQLCKVQHGKTIEVIKH